MSDNQRHVGTPQVVSPVDILLANVRSELALLVFSHAAEGIDGACVRRPIAPFLRMAPEAPAPEGVDGARLVSGRASPRSRRRDPPRGHRGSRGGGAAGAGRDSPEAPTARSGGAGYRRLGRPTNRLHHTPSIGRHVPVAPRPGGCPAPRPLYRAKRD